MRVWSRNIRFIWFLCFCLGMVLFSTVCMAEQVTLTLIGWGPELRALRNDAPIFEAANPNIKLEIIDTGRENLVDKTTVMAVGGTSPDLIWTDDGVLLELANLGALEPLAPYVKKDNVNLAQYAPTTSGEYGGVLLAFPGVSYPYVFFYNVNLLNQAGLAEPTANWTFDDYRNMSVRLTTGPEEKRTVYGTVAPHRRSDGFLRGSGGWPFTADSKLDEKAWPKLIEITQWMADFVHTWRIAGGGDGDFHQGRAAFGHFGYWIFGDRNFASWSFDYGAQVHPKGPAGQIPKFITNGWAISQGSQHKDAAWKFIRWYTSPEQQLRMARAGQMPAYLPVLREAFKSTLPSSVVEAFVKTFTLAAAGRPEPKNTQEAITLADIQEAMRTVFNGKNPSAADALNSVKDRVAARLAQGK